MARSGSRADERGVEILAGGEILRGILTVPAGASGLVIFAHGSGSSRLSPRNRQVAYQLSDRGLATLRLDLLTAEEEAEDAITAELRFDIGLLARRLVLATEWAVRFPASAGLRIGYFGSSTGAAAALVAAAERPELVQAIVSRGGRPDLAGDALERVQAPALFIVGGDDREVLELNEEALQRLPGAKHLAVIPKATHLFEEPGALEKVAELAGGWFSQLLGATLTEVHP